MTCNKDKRLSYTQKASALVSQMTLKEKIHIMTANYAALSYFAGYIRRDRYNEYPYEAGGCARLGIPALKFCDGPRGVVSGHSTCFPVAMARGATFDTELETRVGEAIGKEVRAHGANFFGGVCLNVPYHPGNGRSQETFSEDSWLIGEMGSALVKGVQTHNVIACIKHFAFNSMERSRFKVNITVDKRTEREVYLPHFKKCIDAGAGALMSAYNKYQGSYCGHSQYLLRRVAKEEWDFDGPVMSDFLLGLRDAAEGLSGGLDIEMRTKWRYTLRSIKKAIRQGKATEEMVDDAALRIVRTLLAFSEAEDPMQYDKSLIACSEHIALAREVAEKSITLIRNEGMLPLDKKTIRTLALVGDLADTANIGDHGSSMVVPPYVKTLRTAIKAEYPEVHCEFYPTGEISSKASEIEKADAVIIVCGCKHSDEGEFMPQKRIDRGGDRESLSLHSRDIDMIRLASERNKNCAVVLMGGNVIMTHEWKDRVAAILMAYYPGMEGGGAIADILFGKVNPSGKLPFAIASKESSYPDIVWDTEQMHYGYYHGYQKIDKDGSECDYPFGYGLSYTTFEMGESRLDSIDQAEAKFIANVKNVGSVAGSEVIQLYIGWKGSAVDRPVRVLRSFAKVHLEPGEESAVELSVKKSDLAYYDSDRNDWVQEDITYVAFIGTDEQSCVAHSIEFQF